VGHSCRAGPVRGGRPSGHDAAQRRRRFRGAP
jgi:hypothetical protein